VNYDQEITDLVGAIKADKSIIQPWRNKATARLEEAQAFVRMGKTSSSLKAETMAEIGCICTALGRRKDCPIHGD
jgi:hypothetical protein